MKLIIRALEGIHEANVGNYIVQEVAGEIYPYKPDTPPATYESTVMKVSVNVMAHLDEDEVGHEADGS